MASFGQTAALLQIGVRADTAQATSALRRMDQTTKQAAASAQRLTSTQGRQGSAFRSSSSTLSRYGQSATKASQANRQLHTSTTKLSTSMKDAAKGALAAGAAYIGIAQAKEAVDTTTDLAKATLGLHHNLDLSLKTAGAFAAEAKARGIENTKLTMTTKTLSNAIEGAKNGTESQVEAFKTLGITAKELKTQSMDRILFAIADGSKAAGDSTERTAALGKLLGRSFGPLRAMFSGGAAGLREMFAAVNEAGANVAQGKGIKGIHDLIEQQRQMKRETLGLQVAFTQNLAPALIAVMKAFGNMVRGVKSAVEWLGGMPGPLKAIVSISGIDLVNAIGKAVGAVRNLGSTVGNIIGKVKDWFGSLPGKVKNAIGGLAKIIAQPFVEGFQHARNIVGSAVDFVRDKVSALIGIFQKLAGKVSGPVVSAFHAIKDAADAIVRTVTKVINVFKQAAEAPKDLFEKGKSLLGAAIPGQTGGRVTRKAIKLATGGVMVPGSGSGDKVPAMLEPG